MPTSFYDLTVPNPSGKPVSFADFKGKVVLVVNTATQCGLTPQFDGLEHLHKTYKDQGLAVIGFPSNQFAGQEPVADADIEAVCKMNHGVTFPLMAKSDVNGPATNPVFAWLKENAGGVFGDDIKWNFTKFLVSRDGTKVRRFAPTTEPKAIEDDLVKFLKD